MAEPVNQNPPAPAEPGAPAEPPKTFTQAEVDALMGKVRREERGKYADYDDLKAKAAKFDEGEEAKKSELERAQAALAEAKAEADRLKAEAARAALVSKVSQETGVPASLLVGGDEEALKASAKAVSDYVASVAPGYPKDKGAGSPGGAPVTRESIEKIADQLARIEARARHADLYE